MNTIVNNKIPEEYVILCAVNKGEDLDLFTDELIGILFSTMKEKWLPLKAFKKITKEFDHDERLYLAYNPKIIDRSRVSQVSDEIKDFFHALSPDIIIEEGIYVKQNSRNNYNEIVSINTDEFNINHWNFQISPYYKPYLLSIGKSEEDASRELSLLKGLQDYRWCRIKKRYLGNSSIPDDIDKFLVEFICLNKNDDLDNSILAYKSYKDFIDNKKTEFAKEYDVQKQREELKQRVLAKEVEVIDSTIEKDSYDAFLKWNHNFIYDTQNYWKRIVELCNNGWNEKGINGYKEDKHFFIFEEDMRLFVSGYDSYLYKRLLGNYLSAMEKYLQFKWERDHAKEDYEIIKEGDIVQTAEESEAKKIRIDINMDDIDEFLDFLEHREVNRQKRKKYIEGVKDLYQNGWNEYKHSTYIDDKSYKVNTKDIEVFVNGLKTRDFNIQLSEYEESLGLYLSYRWEKEYKKPTAEEKEESVSPVIVTRISPEKEEKTETKEDIDGKKIYVNIEHMDEYKSSKNDDDESPSGPSVIYVGDPERERKNKTMQVSSIKEDDDTVTVSIDFDGKQEQGDSDPEKIIITLDYLPRINYAMMNSGMEACNSFIIENKDNRDWKQLQVSITGEYIKDSSCRFECLRQGLSVQASSIDIVPDIKVLSELTESIKTSFRLFIEDEQEVLIDKEYPMTLLAYDEWAGSSIMPESLAAFVVPNNPLLPRIKVEAAKFLEKWTGSSVFDEYQTQDRNRVRAQVAAIYEALRSEGIVYSAPPASFEETGQRIRLADKVLTVKIGTCVDTSLLFASCLEEAGIYPIIVVLKGHALVGAWLTPNVFHHMVCDDPSYLLKEIADGNNNIVLLESTAITSSEHINFDDAVSMAVQKVSDESIFLYFVDVHRCRLGNILPIPQRIMKDGSWEFVNEGIDHDHATDRLNELNHYDLRLDNNIGSTTKQMIWERKLLDFSLRNNLLNTRLGRKVVPFISFNIEHLEDHLQNGEDFFILPSPGKKIMPNIDGMYDSISQAPDYQKYVLEMINDHKIASYLTETELQLALKNLYRTARTSIEENGANSLFLTLGMLRWFETEKSIQPRFAPILLLPVDIIRKSGNNYVIRKRDEDIILNITLVELLKQNFKIKMDLLKELPKDESGVDVKKIFTIFRRAIIQQKKWNIQEESMLGLFSFNKFVMWNDIHTNADKLKENVVISSLIDNRNKQPFDGDILDAREIDKSKKPMDFAIPLDVDSSQMEAIVESGRGKSFILHGPPGTGKSQTITNMIANALYQGRRVLFVAEKMAALSVVQARLEKLHLAPFCLELHSNKATKKHFLEQMDEVLKIKRITPPENYDQNSEELYKQRKELIDYMESLHKKGDSGYSLYDSITEYLDISEDEITDNLPDLNLFNVAFVEKARSFIDDLFTILDISGKPCGHPLKRLVPKDNRLETLDAIQTILNDLKSSFADYVEKVSNVEVVSSFKINCEEDLKWLESFNCVVSGMDLMNKGLLDLGADELTRSLYIKDVELGKNYSTLRKDILSLYSDSILDMNVDSYKNEYEIILDKWFLPRYFAKRKYFKGLHQYGHITEDNLQEVLSDVKSCQSKRKELDKMSSELKEIFGILALRDEEQWDKILYHIEHISEISSLIADYSEKHELKYKDCIVSFVDSIDGQWNIYKRDFENKATSAIDMYNHIVSSRNNFLELTDEDLSLEEIKEEIDKWIDNYKGIKEWYFWIDKKRNLKESNLSVVADKIENDGYDPLQAINGVLKGLFRQFIIKNIDESDQLRMFNSTLFRQNILKYKENTKKFQELSKRELYSRLASRIPSSGGMAEGSEINILKRNIANGGRGTSIRNIIDSIPTLFPRLCPCMLMSPISVAQFIDLNRDKFDLVIFDEASQMPTSEAVGAIARGKALIVVGDRKQMPPTSFFSSSQVDDEEAEIDDMESILDDCITLSLPEYKLQWHYRSKHESLIAFSNSQYYNNELFTFPSVDDQTAKVKLVPIQGVYDKGRTRSNPDEAKAIVKEIIRRLSDKELSKSSIGVVAFSKVQGDLIEDELLEQLDKHPELKDIAYNEVEPIFIKNLENVQGDERDVILFSIGYGADKYGKVSMNFGPLNNAGGERRLNVAVSRARKEMMVFSSLSSRQIDLKRSQAKGVEGLKGFLEFAETGRLPIIVNTITEETNNNLVKQLCQALNENGYCTKPHVGRSNFKVDIAVSTKDDPENYILGILCDGKSYFETKTTRDREIVQPTVLEMLNWKVMRVYSIDWYENKDKALSQILNELETLQKGEEESSNEEPAEEYKFNVDNVDENDIVNNGQRNEGMRPYEEANASWGYIDPEFFSPYNISLFDLLKNILKKEQPVNENYLGKLVAKAIQFGHAGSNIQRLILYAAQNGAIYKDPLLIGRYPFYWIDEESSKDYHTYRSPSPRSISEIPAIEIINVIKELVNEEIALPKDKIPTFAAKKFGFSGAGKAICTSINDTIKYMLQHNILVEKGDYICLNEET